METAYQTLAEIERSLRETPRRRFVIPGVLPTGPCLLYGASGAGKTGLAIRTAIAAASGLHWADRQIVHGAVLYVCGEDVDGAKERMVAAARTLGLDPASLPIGVMGAPVSGIGRTDARIEVGGAAEHLARQTGHPVVLIMIDTLAACFGEKSQDDASAASEYMNSTDSLARHFGCCVLSIHHTGKNENAGMRGSRVFFDRADAVVRVERGKGTSTSFLKVEKMRNGPGGARFAFDIDGAEITSAGDTISVQVIRDLRALADDTGSSDDVEEKRKQTIADQMLAALVRIGGVSGASVLAWQSACYDLWTEKKAESRRKVFSAAKKRMMEEGIVSVMGETVTVTVTSDAKVTPMVTPVPETVTVTVTNPPSIEGGDSDRRTGRFPKHDGKSLAGPVAVPPEVSVGRTNVLPRGCGGETPAIDPARDDGDGDGRGRQADEAA